LAVLRVSGESTGSWIGLGYLSPSLECILSSRPERNEPKPTEDHGRTERLSVCQQFLCASFIAAQVGQVSEPV
jgi:hypothetical protein